MSKKGSIIVDDDVMEEVNSEREELEVKKSVSSEPQDPKPSTQGLPFDVERPEETEHLNMIIYGDTGVGKTHLAGTAVDFAGTNEPLFIDFEGGTKTLHGKEIDVTRPKNWKDIQAILDYLVNDNTKYKCVIIDPLTELQKKHSMGYILGELDDDRGYTDLARAEAPTRQDWLRSGEQMWKFIRAFRDLAYLKDKSRRVHVIMTALERYDEKRSLMCPSLPGALGPSCGAAVDILARLSKEPKEVEDPASGEIVTVTRRFLLTDDFVDEVGTKFMAKNRGNRLGRGMWEPTIDKILGVWNK